MPLDGIGQQRVGDLNRVGSELMLSGQLEPARAHLMAALLLAPDHSVLLSNMAGLLYKTKQYEMGVLAAKRAIQLSPGDFRARNNISINLVTLGRTSEAHAHIQTGLRLKPDDPPLLHTLGTALTREGKFAEAEAVFRKARKLGYDEYATRNDQSLVMLAQGKIKEALELYEVRWEQLYQNPVWRIGIPEWKGQNLSGKSILVHCEQGYGDTLMLVRFVRQIIETCGKNVGIAVQKPLVRLIQENFPNHPVWDVENIPTRILEWTDCYDYHTPMLSMIGHLNITPKTISPKPYLTVSETLVRPLPGKFKIGLCWASGDHGPDLETRRRILPLAEILAIAAIPNVQVVSLQKDSNSKQLYDLGAETLVIDPMSRVEDFYDTARIIKDLDLVLSVDSAVAHLSGGMGKSTIVFGPRPRCWRWWGQPSGLPWYENMRIYDQDESLSWSPAIRHALRDVERFVSTGEKHG